jgi:hypothetical protein
MPAVLGWEEQWPAVAKNWMLVEFQNCLQKCFGDPVPNVQISPCRSHNILPVGIRIKVRLDVKLAIVSGLPE